jgi:alpha-1,2-mannosyltransferase
MHYLTRTRENWVVFAFAIFALATMLLCSPYYQGLLTLKWSLDQGRLTPNITDDGKLPFGGDFLSEWVAGGIVRNGDRSRLYDRAYAYEVEHDPARVPFDFDKNALLLLLYPPAYYVLVTPFSYLPLQWAAMLWCALMAACLIAAATLAARTCPEHPRAFAWTLFLAFLFFPMIHNLNTGQKATLWLMLFTGVFVLLRAQRPFTAGLVFGLVALKPPLAIAIGLAMLAKGQWRFVAGSALSVLGIVALSFSLGTDVFFKFVECSLNTPDLMLRQEYSLLEMEHSFYSFLALPLRDHAPPLLVKVVAGLLTLFTLAAVWRLLRGKLDFASDRFSLQYAGLVLATVLVSPRLLTYDLTLVLLPVFLLARAVALRPAWLEERRTQLILAAVALFIGTSACQPIAHMTKLHVGTVTMLAVLVFLVRVNRPMVSAGSLPLAMEQQTTVAGAGVLSIS